MPAAALSDGCTPEWEFRVVRLEDGDARKVTGEYAPVTPAGKAYAGNLRLCRAVGNET
ncbi:hypothetical protein [Nocardia sp. X0981]